MSFKSMYGDNPFIGIGPRVRRPLARVGEVIRLQSERPLERGSLDSLFPAHYNGMLTGGSWAPVCGIEITLRRTMGRVMTRMAIPDGGSIAMGKPPITGRIKPIFFIGITGAFVLWGFWFINRTSFMAIDGRRYFSLFDDAMVSMRYAWNFAHGNGLVWNIGEHVEGYTNLLQTLVMSFFALVLDKATAVVAVQILGVGVMIVTAWLAVLVSRHIQLGRFDTQRTTFELITFMGVLWYYPLVYWSVMGMETGLLTGLVLLATLFVFRFSISRDPHHLMWAALVLGLAFLTRPDSVIVAAVILGYGLLELARMVPKRRALLIGGLAILIYLLLPIGQTLFRINYYGSFWPNTYYLKVEGFPLTQRIRNGLAFMLPFFKENWLLLLLAGVAAFHQPSKQKRLLLVVGGALIAYQILIGGDAWRMWRMVSPGVPLLLILFNGELVYLAGAGGESLNSWIEKRWGSRATGAPGPLRPQSKGAWPNRPLLTASGLAGVGLAIVGLIVGVVNPTKPPLAVESRAGLIWGALTVAGLAILILRRAFGRTAPSISNTLLGLAFFVALGSLNARFLPEMLELSLPYQVEDNESNANTAVAVLSTTTDDARVGVIWAGTIPYYTGRYAIDFLGKTDPRIAHLPPELGGASRRGSMLTWPGHNKYDLEYSIGELRPTYVQQFDWGRQHLGDLRREAYVQVAYKGVSLWLLRDSPSVLWGEVRPTQP